MDSSIYTMLREVFNEAADKYGYNIDFEDEYKAFSTNGAGRDMYGYSF